MKSAKQKLTNKLVSEFKSNPFTAENKIGKPYFIHEETSPGLSLRVQPTWRDKQGKQNQGSKTWIFRYRSRGQVKTTKDWKIGRVLNISLEQAKKEVDKIKVNLAKGIEPSVEKKKKENEEKLGDLINKYYHNHLTTQKGFRKATITGVKDCFRVWIFKKTKDLTCIRRFIDRDISTLRISQINKELISSIHASIGGGPDGATYSANRFVAYLKMFFTWAIEHKYFNKENPCKIKKKYLFPEKRYDDRLSEEERENVYTQGILIDQRTNRLNYNQYREKGLSPVACMLIAFQLASGRRTKSEAGSIKWSMISFPNREITYEQTKTSKKNDLYTFPLGPKAIEILQLIQRDRLNNEKSKFYFPIEDVRNKYVFPSHTFGKIMGNKKICEVPHIQEVRATWNKLLKLAGIERHLKNYATRHTVGALVIEETEDPNAVAEILGVTVETALGYAKTSKKKVREVLNRIDRKKVKEPLKIVN